MIKAFERTPYQPYEDMTRVATATPEVAVGDVETNAINIAKLYREAANQDVSLVVFPEMSLTGYTIQDLVQSPELLSDVSQGLGALADETTGQNTAAIVGCPVQVGNALYNSAAVIAQGQIRGIVPKQNLPNYNEFYDKRWFQTWDDKENITIRIGGQDVPFGRKQLFNVAGASVGIEICEDLWVGQQPSIELTANGATIIANPSASPEVVTKRAYRRGLVESTAGRLVTAYVYSGADSSESVSSIVMSGHAMINEAGHKIVERKPLDRKAARLLIADIDTAHIQYDRIKDTNYLNKHDITPTSTGVHSVQKDIKQAIDAHPFTPKGSSEYVAERLEEIFTIQAVGLARKMEEAGVPKVVLGLSGGLDSTLALLVAVRASEELDLPASEVIHTLTMPSTASSDRTQNNAVQLAEALGIPNEEIPIADMAAAQLQAMQHGGDQDITYENTQARLRQAFVFNKGNQIGALALGTGDLSEIALGWCTYNGDHMSAYNPNGSIPKTLVRDLTRHASTTLDGSARSIVEDILDTPVSPELTGDGSDVSQKTEDLIGPYELHDFFMYRYLRWLEPKRKIGFMAMKAFEDRYSPQEIAKWLDVFINRFSASQWKRQAMPDGAKVGISLNPRSDFRAAPKTKQSKYEMVDILTMQDKIKKDEILV